MNMPIKFPGDVEVIADEAARFRALPPAERLRTLNEMFRLYHFLLARSARPEALARLACEEEERGRAAIEEFVRKHG
jgi:hypothetical protein